MVLLIPLAIAACGGGGGSEGGAVGVLEPPTAGDPAFGTVGHVLVSDDLASEDASVDYIWIGFNREIGWEHVVALHERLPREFWIGGRVVVDASQPLGFYFDPATTRAGEVTAVRLQTTLDALRDDPVGHASQAHNWVIIAVIEDIVPSAAP